MTYPVYCKNKALPVGNRGMILIDILLALSFGALFIAFIAESLFNSQEIFARAQERKANLDVYENTTSLNVSVSPYQSVVSNGIKTFWRPYGNEMTQTDIDITSSTSTFAGHGRVSLKKIQKDPTKALSSFTGTPWCSVEIASSNQAMSILPITLSMSPSPFPMTDLEMRNGIAYTSFNSSIASDPDVAVFNIKNPQATILKSSLNTGPGIAALSVAGFKIFAAAASTAAQLHVITINSASYLMSLQSKYQLPLPYATATPPFGSAIFFKENKVYLGTEKWDGQEFAIIDVTNPAVPVKVGGVEIGSKVNDILVQNNIAYLSTADERQFMTIDVTNVTSPSIIGSVSPSGWSRQEGKIASYFEGALNTGRTSGGFNIVADHELFSFSTTSALFSLTSSSDVVGGIYGIVTDRNNIYVITRQVGKEFQVINRNSWIASTSYALPTSPLGETCDGKHIYVPSSTSGVIYDITGQ